MKTLFSILCTFFLFICSFQPALILVDYQINRDFYEFHCENKAKKEILCNGKCLLTKNSNQNNNTSQFLKICFDFSYLPNFLETNLETPIEYPIYTKKFTFYNESCLDRDITILELPPNS